MGRREGGTNQARNGQWRPGPLDEIAKAKGRKRHAEREERRHQNSPIGIVRPPEEQETDQVAAHDKRDARNPGVAKPDKSRHSDANGGRHGGVWKVNQSPVSFCGFQHERPATEIQPTAGDIVTHTGKPGGDGQVPGKKAEEKRGDPNPAGEFAIFPLVGSRNTSGGVVG